jgi:hypothetical protein
MHRLLSFPVLKTTLKTGLTVAYLFSALAITVATSKGGSGSGTSIGVTNYAISTSCPGSLGDMVVRSNSGTIEKSIFPNGQPTQKPVDYRKFGFPNKTLLVGMDQIGIDNETSCKIIEKTSVTNNGYDESKPFQSFHTLGQLTTFTYSCTKPQGATCRIVVRELPTGPLEEVYF